jgi:hypothetical protein
MSTPQKGQSTKKIATWFYLMAWRGASLADAAPDPAICAGWPTRRRLLR